MPQVIMVLSAIVFSNMCKTSVPVSVRDTQNSFFTPISPLTSVSDDDAYSRRLSINVVVVANGDDGGMLSSGGSGDDVSRFELLGFDDFRFFLVFFVAVAQGVVRAATPRIHRP